MLPYNSLIDSIEGTLLFTNLISSSEWISKVLFLFSYLILPIEALGNKYSISKEKFLLYKSMGKIKYENKKRTLDIHSLDEIKFVNSKVPSIELVNEL